LLILIDIHSQQQTRELSDENVQFDIIDAIADNPANIQQYQALLKSYKADKTKLNSLVKKQGEALKEQSTIVFY
jgi:DNA repair protein RecN (Recombination protein N)